MKQSLYYNTSDVIEPLGITILTLVKVVRYLL